MRYKLLGLYILLGCIFLLATVIHSFLWLWALLVFSIVLIIGFRDFFQVNDNVRKNYPLFGSFKAFVENQRHVIQEALLLKSWEGRPFSLLQINYVKKKATNELLSLPFGSELDFRDEDFYWCDHSLFPLIEVENNFRVLIGSSLCKKPYNSSVLNVGAMSYGSISSAAVSALCKGAKNGGFAVNTGEGGISKYHKESDCDLIWQIGTGYFGCRDEEGNFDEESFEKQAILNNVKMIEIKISQGAKPGFGAILPASKNTTEIASIRKVEAGSEIHSPAYHKAFGAVSELLVFIDRLRTLSGGKPVGIKFCLGKKLEVIELCKSMVKKRMFPDFIVVEGAEGGSGAADLDSIHHVGGPLKESLEFIVKTIREYNLEKEIKIISSGKIISSIDIAKDLQVGADLCYSARGMMFALGCVQALKCNTNKCPTGITTMEAARIEGLHVPDKAQKVQNYHVNVIEGLKRIYQACGINGYNEKQYLKFNSHYRK